MSESRSLPELFFSQADRLGPRGGVRYKRRGMWTQATWAEWGERVRAAALGLISLGVNKGDRVAILSENRYEWLIADLAILAAGAASVPLHAPLTATQIQYMLGDCEACAVIASNATQTAKIDAVTAALPRPRWQITMEPMGASVIAFPRRDVHAKTLAPTKLSLDRLEQLGRSAPGTIRHDFTERFAAIGPSDLASIIYTSGTTGQPKGVMLTHGNFLSNAEAMTVALAPIEPGSIFFNWLPLSHVYARTVDYYLAIAAGATMALSESADTVVADVTDIRPMHFSSVPRFYEKVLGSLMPLPPETRQAKLHAIFGPRLRFLGCGGAALPPAIAEAYRDAGFEVIVGYGLTESSPVIATNRMGANKLGSVGQVIPGVEVKIAADGEILTKGPHVMAGYWNQTDATAAVIHNGWLATGDLGRLDDDGFLWITGRKKEIIVLSSGKNVSPVQIEGLLLASPLIEQVAVFGDGQPCLTAVVVPRGSPTLDALQAEIDARLDVVAPWEKVRKIVVSPRPFTVGSGELTVSLKLRRQIIFENHRSEIDRPR
jgi:long-chain acyl-CoA synthetase